MKSFLICLVCALFATPAANAATIFESGTLGSTGVTWSDLQNQTVPGTNINSGVFTGVRFELAQPVITSQVGGHFVGGTVGTLFGAIVKLDNASDFPNSGDLSSADVLGAATLTFPIPSAEVFGNLNLSLNPGWYALVFGSGLFGTSGYGGAVRNGTDIGDPSYIGHQPSVWINLDTLPLSFDNHRFVINGVFVPEPSTFVTAVLLFVGLRLRRFR
jgi:hypothetical protein